MSYLVLARKYRPTTFSEVVGQDHVTRTLANAFASGRVHHAFLFCGPRGVGKTTLARILGKALNCECGPTAEPCGTCSACASITQGNAVDYYEMDGASNRGIDAIRELTEAVRYQPALLRKKVYVIDEVHMLTTEAFNALLKTLEEPPPHVTFVLATTEPHKVPNTILSRCQRYDFKLVPSGALHGHLERIFAAEKLAVESAALSLIVRESGGSARDALSLADQVISFVGPTTITEAHVAEVLGVADRALTRTIVSALAAGDAAQVLLAADAASARGIDEVQLARATVRYLRDLVVLQVAPSSPELVDASADERAALAEEAAAIPRPRLTQMFERMLRASDDLGKTMQPRLVLDLALIDTATLEPLVPLGDLLDRLGAMERRLGDGGAPPRPSGTSRPGGEPGPSRGGTERRATASAADPARSMSTGPVNPAEMVARPDVGDPRRVNAPASGVGPADENRSSQPAPAVPERTPRESVEVPPRPAVITASNPVVPPPLPAGAATVAAAGSTLQVAPTLGFSSLPVTMRWNAVLDALEQRRRTLFGHYQHARVMEFSAETLELGFAPSYELADMARDNADAVRLIVSELAGKPISVKVRVLSAAEAAATPARSMLEDHRARTDDERRRREAEAREHPVTRLVLETFGAAIKEIKTDV